jgi:hypothetical protein
MFPWPESLRELTVVDGQGARAAKIERSAARPISDGTWAIEQARVAQVEPRSRRPANWAVFVQLAIVNQSEQRQRVSMFDVSVLDAEGRLLRLDPKGTLFLKDRLDSRSLEPGERFSGWLRFLRRGTGARALIFAPSRASRLHAPLPAAPHKPPTQTASGSVAP